MPQMLGVGRSQYFLKRTVIFISIFFLGKLSLLLVYAVLYFLLHSTCRLISKFTTKFDFSLFVLILAANRNLVMETIDLQPLKKDGSDEGILPSVASHAPSCAQSKHNEKLNHPELSDDPESGKSRGEVQMLNSIGRPGSSVSLNSDGAAGTSSGPVLSPSSSMGSLSSEKSTLNPRAKVFFFCWTQ